MNLVKDYIETSQDFLLEILVSILYVCAAIYFPLLQTSHDLYGGGNQIFISSLLGEGMHY